MRGSTECLRFVPNIQNLGFFMSAPDKSYILFLGYTFVLPFNPVTKSVITSFRGDFIKFKLSTYTHCALFDLCYIKEVSQAR